MKKCRSCSLPDRRLLSAKGKLPMCKSTYFLLGLSSHVMPTPAYSVAWKSTIRRSQSMPADWPCLVYALFMPSMWVWCDMRSSHVMPTMACAMAGIYGCGLQESAHLNMKTRYCISGWGGVVPLGLWLDALSSSASRRRRYGLHAGVLP